MPNQISVPVITYETASRVVAPVRKRKAVKDVDGVTIRKEFTTSIEKILLRMQYWTRPFRTIF